MQKSPVLVGLGGSLREKSYSNAALHHALRIAEAEEGIATELLDLRDLNLPMFLPDLTVNEYPMEYRFNIERLLQASRRAHVMIWSSPTYHGTISGALKNALDFMELLSDDEPPYLQGRAVGLIAVNDSTTFSAMINSVHELRAWLAPTQVVLSRLDFTPELKLHNERAQRRLLRLVNELLDFAKRSK